MTTMRDVASRAEVSLKTVSRVFNEDPHVLPETRRRVEAAMAALNYTPNMLAKTFRDGRSPVIGVAVPSIAEPFFSALTRGVEEVAAQHDMSVLVSSLGHEHGHEHEVVESLLRRQLGALVVAPVAGDQSYLARWVSKLPVITVDRPPRGVSADCYLSDDFGGARAATLHLIEHGHRRIAFAGYSGLVPTTATRLSGYRAALHEAGVEVDDDLVTLFPATQEGAAAAVHQLADAKRPPTALFSSDAASTMLLIPALAGRTWALVAFGDFPMASMLSPALTVVDQDPMALGRLAAERAVHRINGHLAAPVQRVTIPVRLLERQSCRVDATSEPMFSSSVPRGEESVVWVSPTAEEVA